MNFFFIIKVIYILWKVSGNKKKKMNMYMIKGKKKHL